MTPAQVIVRLAELGLPVDKLSAALEILEAMEAGIKAPANARKEKDRERKRDERASKEIRGLSMDCPRTEVDNAETPSPLVPPLEVSPAPLPKTPPIIPPTEQTKRGTRLPADFEPDASCQAVAEELLLTAPQSQAIFAEFTDHWKSAPGQRGVKLDWQATFRNWLRNNAHKHKGKQNGSYRESNNSIDRSLRVVSAVADESIRRAGGLGESGGLTDSEKLSRLWQSVR